MAIWFFGWMTVVILPAQTMGLLLNTPDSFNGYTLLSNNESSYLIDNCGMVVNRWESQYKTGHGLYLMNNGDLLRAGSLPGTFDAGGRGGIIELYDWDGTLKWSYTIADDQQHAHHDLALLPNGNFLCTVWERHSEAEAKAKGRQYNGEVWSEKIMELKIMPANAAEIIWQWSVWDHLIQDTDPALPDYGSIADHPERIDINYIGEGHDTEGNWLHVNAIAYHAELNQIVISSRNLSEIYVIDHSTNTAEAATHEGGRYGKGGDILYRYGNPQVYDRGTIDDQQLRGQHDIRWLPEGHSHAGAFMVFNNEYLPDQQSRVQIFNNPATAEGLYFFDATNGYGPDTLLRSFTMPGLYSDILSGAQALPNGNLLILEGRSGHLREINDEDEVVWEYIYPVNRNGGPGIQGGEPRFNLLFRSKRYAPDFVGFADKNLSPTVPIELSPDESNCTIFSNTTPTKSAVAINQDIVLRSRSIRDVLHIENKTAHKLTMELYQLNGQMLQTQTLQPAANEINLSQLSSGLYLVAFRQNHQLLLVEKIVKL